MLRFRSCGCTVCEVGRLICVGQLFGSPRLQTTTMRATLGVVHYGEFDTSLLKLQYLEGVWQPEPDFYTCDSLPKVYTLSTATIDRLRSM